MSTEIIEIKRENNLPVRLKDLRKFVLIGREKLIAVRAEMRAIDKLGIATVVKDQKRGEAEDLAEALLDAEVRIGELLLEIPKNKSFRGNQYRQNTTGGILPKSDEIKNQGFTNTQSHRYQQLAQNQDLVEIAKATARKNEDLVTRSEVLRLASARKITERNEKFKKVPLPEGEYDVIYCDPPWKYDFAPTTLINIEKSHYPTMTLEDLIKYKIPDHKNSVLFMWATNPKLKDALHLMEAWGYTYKTNACWDKIKPTHSKMGFWFFGRP